MNTKAILDAIANNLEKNVQDECFDINCWRCGTVGCAIGYSFELPEVKETGLSCYGENNIPPVLRRKNAIFGGLEAVAQAFEMSFEDARYLFAGLSYTHAPTRAEVIKRIREYISSL